MNTVRAPLDKARAKVEAKQKVRGVLTRHLKDRPEIPEAPAILRAFIEALNQSDPDWIDKADYDFVVEWGKHFIRNGEPLPPPLDQAVVEILDRKRTRKAKGKPAKHGLRNGSIAYAIWLATEAGLHAYRNEASECDSAIDVVSEVLKELGFEKMSYHAVAEIWRQQPKSDAVIQFWKEGTKASPFV